MGIYSSLEGKWYSLLDRLDTKIPVYKIVDPIDKVVPSFILFLVIILIIIFLLVQLSFVSPGTQNGFSITVLTQQKIPLKGVQIKLLGECGEEKGPFITNEAGKVSFNGCEDIVGVKISKEGYISQQQSIFADDPNLTITLSAKKIEEKDVTVLIINQRKDVLVGATLTVKCDEKENLFVQNSQDGLDFSVEQGCKTIQLIASFLGYEEKRVNLLEGEEKKIIELEKIVEKGQVIFQSLDNEGIAPDTEINITDKFGMTQTFFTDQSGGKIIGLDSGEYYAVAINEGRVIEISFTINANETEELELLFETKKFILEEDKKFIAVELIDDMNNKIGSAQISFFQGEKALTKRNTNTLGRITPIAINNTEEITGIAKALGFETKLFNVELQNKDSFQQINLRQGGATVNISVFDDQHKIQKDAFISISFSLTGESIESVYTDSNGRATINGLPKGEYVLTAVDKDKKDTVELTFSIMEDETKDLELTLITSESTIKFNILDSEGERSTQKYELLVLNDEGDFENIATKTGNTISSPKIKTGSKVRVVLDGEYNFPYTSLDYIVGKAARTVDLFTEDTTLPNENNLHLFLKEIYEANPITTNAPKTKKVLSGKDYYLYFNSVATKEDYLITNIFVDGASIEGVYSSNAQVFMAKEKESFVIETQSNPNLVDADAEQANVRFNAVENIVNPILVKVKIDQNTNNFSINYQSKNSAGESLLYSKEFNVGEEFCILDCPVFSFSNFIKRGNNAYIPVEENSTKLLIGETYTLKTIIKNHSDRAFGVVVAKTTVPKEKEAYLEINNSNEYSQNINLDPFSEAIVETTIEGKKNTYVAKINQAVEKDSNGINSLRNYEGNENVQSFIIANKKYLVITTYPSKLEAGAQYPFFTIKTKYADQYIGTNAYWYAEKVLSNNERIPLGINGETDANGMTLISFDATNFSDGDTIAFIAYDTQGSFNGETTVDIVNSFKEVEFVPECITVTFNGDETIEGTIIKELEINGTSQLTINSSCESEKTIFIDSDLFVSEKQFILDAGITKTITITAKPKDNLLGVYPLKVLMMDGENYSILKKIDFILNDTSSCFDLSNAAFDMRTKSIVEGTITNKCFSGRKDIYNPKANINTNSVALQYDKPGLPQEISAKIKITGNAIESFVGGLLKANFIGATNHGDDWAVAASRAARKTIFDEYAESICEKYVFDGTFIEKPEPELSENLELQKQNEFENLSFRATVEDLLENNPNRDFNIPGRSVTANDFPSSVSDGLGKQRDAPIESPFRANPRDWGSLYGGIDPQTEKEVNTSPSHYPGSNSIIEFFWDKKHDPQGNPAHHALFPPGFVKTSGCMIDGFSQECIYSNGVGEEFIFYKVSIADGETRSVMRAGYVDAPGALPNQVYIKVKVEGDEDAGDKDDASLVIHNEWFRLLELFSQRQGEQLIEINLNEPVEGRIYDFGSYDIHPIPEWTGVNTVLDGKKVGDEWTGTDSDYIYKVMCINPQGIVEPKYVEERTTLEPLADVFIAPDENHLLIEYSPTGGTWYEVDVNSIKDLGFEFFLRNGNLYGKYVGNITYDLNGSSRILPQEEASPEIDFSLTKKNLLGEEYAILTIEDWVGNTKEKQDFRIKLIGNEHTCYSIDGDEGVTGSEFVPKLLFNWKWDQISSNQCETTNPNYTYCDAVQFNISIFKKLVEIDNLITQNKLDELPAKTTFYAYLIKDGYSENMLTDFSDYYSTAFADAPTSFIAEYNKFIEENKISYSPTTLPYGGLYRVEINIEFDDDQNPKLISLGETKATIQINLVPVKKAKNYTFLYEIPFDGKVGEEKREGYGVSILGDSIQLNVEEEFSNNSTNPLKKLSTQINSNLTQLAKGYVIEFDSELNHITLSPSQPTPVALTISNGYGKIKASYSISGTGAESSPQKEWKLIDSTIGNDKCEDFDGQNRSILIEDKDGATKRSFSWDGKKAGTITIGTVFLTPKEVSNTLLIIPNEKETQLSSYDYLQNSDAIMLNNYDALGINNYDSLKEIFENISDEKMCISKEGNVKIWWNEEYLDSLLEEVFPNSC